MSVDEWAFRGVKGYEFAQTVNAGLAADVSKPLKDWFADLGQDENVKLVLSSIDCWLSDNSSYVSESCTLTLKSSNRSLDLQEFAIEQGASKTWLLNLPKQPEMTMLDAIEMWLNNVGNTGNHEFNVQFQFLVFRRLTWEAA